MDAQHAIERGIAAARANKQRTAYYYFYAATQADPDNEQAWLWRASTAPQPRDALFCLAAVLAINPDNPVARHGIEQISAAVAAEAAPDTLTITRSNQKNILWEIFSDKYMKETQFTYTVQVEVAGPGFTDPPVQYQTAKPVTVALPAGRIKYLNPLKISLPSPASQADTDLANSYIKAFSD